MTSRSSANRRAPLRGEPQPTFALDVQYYLSLDPPQLPSQYFYDALGSSLFEAICRLPWYPITRAEMRLLAAHRRHIVGGPHPPARIVELGCGSGEKLTTLVKGRTRTTAPIELHLIDVSASALATSVRMLDGVEDVQVVTHEASYEIGLAECADEPPASGRTLVLLLGSNIGNFDPPGADAFLRSIRAAVRAGDRFLMGADLVKPQSVLQLAYDDPLGVTAAFNRNLLVRINHELGGNFDLESFAHHAKWNAEASRMEMHLVSRRRQTVLVPAADLELTFEADDSIWTESSYKYQSAEIVAMLGRAGFSRICEWVDREDLFSLTLAEAV